MSNFLKNIEKLNKALNTKKLPGKKVQYQMAPPGRPQEYPKHNSFKQAAVTLFLYNKKNEIYFPLIQRTEYNFNDKHKGQISLPGGKLDESDQDLYYCALRELEEELGIKQHKIKPVGSLSELFIPVSNFKVHPYVVYSDKNINFVPQPSEVQYIIEVPLKNLLDNNKIKTGKIILENGMELNDIPYFYFNDHVVWGATAMILNEFKNVIINY